MVVGIVAEFNPFHNGHLRLMQYARQVLGADYIIIAMSGNFTQRGDIAIFDKYTRAEMALKMGADLVLEIPTIFACSSAREYASCGVELLHSTGLTDTILFGVEDLTKDNILDYARSVIAAESGTNFDASMQSLLKQGISYSAARARVMKQTLGADFINTPNNILAIEYTRYILQRDYNINIECLARGNDYNSTVISGDISSATAIRNAMLNGGDYLNSVPKSLAPIYANANALSKDDISLMLNYKLQSEDSFEKYADCTADLSNKINHYKADFTSFTDFCQALKSKDIAYSRLSRVLCHILLNITQAEFDAAKAAGYISNIRLLGFSAKGRGLMGQLKEKSKCPVLTVPDEAVNRADIFAANIYRAVLTGKNHENYPTEFTRKFELSNVISDGTDEGL